MPPTAPTPVAGGAGGRPAGGRPAGGFNLSDEFRRKPAVVLGAAGAGVIVVYALAKRSSGAAAGSGAVSDTGATSNATPAYDSSSSDVYGALEQQFAGLQTQLAGIGTAQQGVPATPTGTTTAPAGPSIASGYYRDLETGNIYNVANNQRYAVSPSTWSKLQKLGTKAPKVTTVVNSWQGFQAPLSKTKV
jgi:hypothetical protein